MSLQVSKQWAKEHLPIFKVFADQGTHPAVAMDRPVCVVGRQYGVNLPLNAPQVSKYHALIVRDGGRIYVRDLASTNGVERNGEPVGEAMLHDDDSLRIGAFTLRCASGFDRDVQGNGDLPGIGANGSQDGDALANDELRVNEEPVPFPPGQRTLLIGRRAQCELQPAGDDVAAVHAVLFTMDGKRFVRDLNTPGGTYVNGEPIHQTELRPGDVLRVGQTTIEYVLGSASTDEPMPLDESRIPLIDRSIDRSIDDSVDEAQRSDAPLIAVAAEAEPPPLERPEDDVSSIEQRAENLLGGSSLVGEIFESHGELPLSSEANEAEEVAEEVAVSDTPAAPTEPVEVVELPGAQADAIPSEVAEPPVEVAAGGSSNGHGPAVELVPAAGVAVPEELAGPSVEAEERYVVPMSELTLADMPAAATVGEPLDDPRQHRDPRADAAGDTIAGEEVITTLVDELANKATTLKHAWEEHRVTARE